MAYGTIKADKITYDDGGSDADANVSDIVTKASLGSPAFTGTPTAPTAAADTNTTQLATTAYVQTEVGDYAPLASPTFTGTVAIPNIANLETAVAANTAKVTNATHTGDVTGDTALTIAALAVETGMIADDAVTTAKLDITTAGTAEASKAVVLDANKDITGLNDITAVDLTLSGDLTVNGTTTTVNSTNTTITDNLLELNSGAGSNANDCGIIIERGSTGDNAIIAWDESADKFTVGTTAGTASSTGNITIAAGTLVASTLEDSKGDVRNIPASTNSTIVAADAGKHISITAGITINASTDFAIGDAVTIFNNQGDGEDETITATGITLYLASDATGSGNRTLAGRGVATILCVATDTYVITGAGLS